MDNNNSTFKKLSLKTRMAYGMGDFGNNFSWNYVSSFLAIFLTDVFGIKAAAVSLLFVIARLWDAVNDPFVGRMADRTNTKYGRYRPWIMVAAPATALLTVLCFWAHSSWGDTAKVVYIYLCYGLLVLAYTCMNLPYGTMAGVMTQDIDERAKLTTMRMTFAMLAIQLLNTIAPKLIAVFGHNGENMGRGYLGTTIVFACLLLIGQGCTVLGCREAMLPTEDQLEYKKKQSLLDLIKIELKNTEFLLVVLVQFIFGIVYYGRAGVYMYYFTYYVGDVNMMTTYSAVGIVPAVVGALLYEPLYRKIGHKGKVGAIAFGATSILCILMYFFNPLNNYTVFIVLAALNHFVFGMSVSGLYSIIPDAVEYGEWKTGERNDGFEYAFVSFLNKCGIAIGTAGMVAILGAIGYVPNVEQTATVKLWINLFMTIIPAILFALGAVAFAMLKVDRNLYAKITADIAARKKAEE